MRRDPQPDHEPATPAPTDDVEGHALPLVVGVSEIGRAKTPAKKAADEPLPSLTKRFPSLRDDQRRS